MLHRPVTIAVFIGLAAAASPAAGDDPAPIPAPGEAPSPPAEPPGEAPATPSPEGAVAVEKKTPTLPPDGPRPPPLHIDYVTYGVAISGDFLVAAGATCREEAAPCILGSGGGLVLRGGYRSPGPWWIGGAYQFSTTDSSNLYRLGTLQQLRAEMRYSFDLGYRTAPYATWGLGGVVYGSEFGVETGGGTAFLGLGFEMQLSRLAMLGGAIYYQPMVFAGFVDTAGFERGTGVAHYLRVELQVELRSELSRD